MGDLNIKLVSEAQAEQLNGYDISLKLDGTLIYFKDKKLFSPRCERSQRYPHILKILIDNNFPDCMGELFISETSNVFDVSRSENWDKVKFMPFDLLDNSLNYVDRIRVLQEGVKVLDNPFIIPMKLFETFKEGWDYVVANKCEGLILRNSNNWFKCKLLQEEKIEIVLHEVGKDKGTFILANGSRISGTSQQFVLQYADIKSKGNKAIAEVEFCFKTQEGKLFQPRLRQIVEVSK
jgi:hypothetical protein